MGLVDEKEILERLSRLEKQNGEFGQAIREMRESLTILSYVQNKQAQVQKQHAEEAAVRADRVRVSEARFERIETNLAEISDKLNGLIAYIDNLPRKEPPKPEST